MATLVSPAGTVVTVEGGPLEARLLRHGWKPADVKEDKAPIKRTPGRPRKADSSK